MNNKRKKYLEKQNQRKKGMIETKNMENDIDKAKDIDQEIKKLEKEKLFHTFFDFASRIDKRSIYARGQLLFYLGIIISIYMLLTLDPSIIKTSKEIILILLASQITGLTVFSMLANRSYYREDELKRLKQKRENIAINNVKKLDNKKEVIKKPVPKMTRQEQLVELKKIREQLTKEDTKGYKETKQLIKMPNQKH